MIIDIADRLKITKEYYFSVKLQEIRKLQSDGKDIINMAIGNPDQPPSTATVETLYQAAKDPQNHGYQAYRSLPELREAIANWYLETYRVALNRDDEILPLIGSKEGITHISLAFLNPGDRVMVPELGYISYKAVAEMVGATAIPYPMPESNHYQPDMAALERMDFTGVKLLWLNYPNMPTGAPASRNTFEALVDLAHKKRVLLCHDNPYSLILNESAPISLLSVPGAREVALELNSMSKSHNMAGWRIGWVSGAKAYIDAIVKIKSNVDSGMFKPVQLAAVEAFGNSDAWHRQRNEIYKNRRSLIYKFLDTLGCSFDQKQVGMFIWAKIPDHISKAEDLVDILLYQYDIFVSPGTIFGEKGRRHIRVSLCVRDEQIEKAVKRIDNLKI